MGFVSGTGQIVSGLEKALQGKVVGDTVDVSFPAEDGYGEVDESLFQKLPRENFPEGLTLEADMVFQAETHHGMMTFRVTEITDEYVVADLNHPLAGKALGFSVVIREVRDATPEELSEDDCGAHECTGCGCH